MGQPEDFAAHLLVVYNSNDPDSTALAQYYGSRRHIPDERVLAVQTPLSEEITRNQFDETIRRPIISYLTLKGWMVRRSQSVQVGDRVRELLVATSNDIWGIVLIRGVPLKIAPDPSDDDSMQHEPELQTNAAAVDNELALLPTYGLPTGGYVPNVFYDAQLGGIKRVGPDLARNIVLVTRLDGPKVSDVRRMIDDTLYAEEHRLAGLAVVDTRGLTDLKDGYTPGDIWLRSARGMLIHDGWDVKFDDRQELIAATDPLNEVALYLGWYAQDAAGPWVTPPGRFVRGAIAYHLHSFSANTLRSETSNWVGPLIAHGAAATMGTVYEPYLALTPHEDVFTRRLLQGDYFAEAAYAAQRGLSWMCTVVGDPLYRPFRVPLETALASASNPHTSHDDWLLLQQTQRGLVAGKIAPKPAAMEHAVEVPGAGAVAEEGLGDLLLKLNAPKSETDVENAYTKALAGDVAPLDRIRVGLKLAQFYSTHNQEARSQAELDVIRELFPEDARRFGVADPLVPTTELPSHSPLDQEPSPASASPSLALPPQPPRPPRPGQG